MDFPLLSYRDPLFSIMMLVAIVFIVSYANYLWSKYKKKSEKKELDKFLDSFQSVKNEKDYAKLLGENPEAISSLMLLASIYYKSGNHEEAIAIYLILLEYIKEKDKKIEVLSMLGKTYYKAGFLHRSRDILKESLRLKPRNQEVLKVLLVILERLKEYSNGFGVLESLEELGESVEKEKNFLKVFLIIEDAKMQDSIKIDKLKELLKGAPYTAHTIMEFLFFKSTKDAWEMLEFININDIIDILWVLAPSDVEQEKIKNIAILNELFSARGVVDTAKKSEIFEFDILINLQEKKEIADLTFEYSCECCKQVFPVYFHRCPSCFSVARCKIEPILTKKSDSYFMGELA